MPDVREFVEGSYVDLELPAALELTLQWYLGVVFERRVSGVDTTLVSWLNSEGDAMMACGVNDDNHPFILTHTPQGFTVVQVADAITVPEDEPVLLIYRCPGSSPAGVSYWNGTTWLDDLVADTNGGVDATTGGTVRVGRLATATDNDWQGGISVIGIGRDGIPTDAQTHALAGGNNITWGDEIPWTEIWEFQQAAWSDPVVGLLGVSSSTAAVGAGTITCPEPPEEFYVLGVPWTSPPGLSTSPVVSGTVQPDETVTCTPGAWRGLPTGFEFQWLLDGTEIPGETEDEYLVVKGDVAHLLACRVTATNDFGPTTATAASRLVAPKPLLPAPATVLRANSLAAGGWEPRTVRYLNDGEWT